MNLLFLFFIVILLLFIVYHLLSSKETFTDEVAVEEKGITSFSDKIMNDIYEEAIDMKKQLTGFQRSAQLRFQSARQTTNNITKMIPPFKGPITEEEEQFYLKQPIQQINHSIEGYDHTAQQMGYQLHLLENVNGEFEIENKKIIENVDHPDVKELNLFT